MKRWGRAILQSPAIARYARRSGPILAAVAINFVGLCVFAASPTSAMHAVRPPHEDILAVTLVPVDAAPVITVKPSAPLRTATAGEAIPSVTPRRRKAEHPAAPAPEAADDEDIAPLIAPHDASVGPLAGVPPGLKSLMESKGCDGPTSEKVHADCKGRYAKLVPPQDDWSLPSLKSYEAQFGEVVGVEEKRRRFIAAMALMGKPAGHLDPVWGD